MKNKFTNVWQALETARSELTSNEFYYPMNPPATPEILEQRLARILDMPIPQQLRDSLLVHNGMNHREGSWFQSFIPCCVERIETIWRLDRQRQAEANAEGSPFDKKSTWIPVVIDEFDGELGIYIDAADGSIVCYEECGCRAHKFRYESYLDFLKDILGHIRNDRWFDWPQVSTKTI